MLEAIRQKVAAWLRYFMVAEPRLKVRFLVVDGTTHLVLWRRDARGRLPLYLYRSDDSGGLVYAPVPDSERIESELGPEYDSRDVLQAIDWAAGVLWRRYQIELLPVKTESD